MVLSFYNNLMQLVCIEALVLLQLKEEYWRSVFFQSKFLSGIEAGKEMREKLREVWLLNKIEEWREKWLLFKPLLLSEWEVDLGKFSL